MEWSDIDRVSKRFREYLTSILLMATSTDLHSFKPIREIIAISKEVLDTPTKIPTRATGRKPFSISEPSQPSQFARVLVPLKRGEGPYCPARVAAVGYIGESCLCHNPNSPVFRRHSQTWGYHIRPELWSTTPAEADVNPRRQRRVGFAETLVTSVQEFDRWYLDTYGLPESSPDDPYYDDEDVKRLCCGP